MITLILLDEIVQLSATTGLLHGFCPFCGAKGHVSTSRLGNRFFALDKGEIHTNPICARIASEPRTPDVSVTNFKSLFSDLLQDEKRFETKQKGGEDNHPPIINTEQGGDENQLVPIRSLRRIAQSQVLIGGPMQITGDGELITRYLIRPSWLPLVAESKIELSGSKIFEAFFLAVIEKDCNSVKKIPSYFR